MTTSTQAHSWDGPFSGVFAAALNATNPDGSINFEHSIAHAKWLLANGCDGLGISGTTGEANSFSISERKAILDALISADVSAEKLMPGTGVCAIPDTVDLTRHSVQAGCPGVLMLPPFYYKNPTDEGLVSAFSRIIDQVDDDRLRVYLYHFPQMAGVSITEGVIGALRQRYPGIVVGMKDSSGDLENMAGIAERHPGFAVFSGSESAFLDLAKRGGAGCITAVSNVGSALAQTVWQAWRDHGADAPENEPLKAMRTAISAQPLFAALKAVQARHTGNGVWENMRPPLTPLDDAQRQSLFAAVDAIGYEIPKAA